MTVDSEMVAWEAPDDGVEGVAEVGDEVVGGLDADGEPDQRGVDGEG